MAANAPPSYGGPISSTGMYPQNSPGALISKVEIHVSCQNLRDRDLLSKSDPMVVLFLEIKDANSKRWKEIGRTETVKDDLDPKFVKSFLIEYHFEELQRLKFEVYDSDSTSALLQEHDFLGKVEVNLGSIVGEYGGKVTKPLCKRNGENTNSSITFATEELNDSKEIVELSLRGRKLDKKDFFGSSDPFLVFHRHGIEGPDTTPVHKTEVIKNNLNPSWKLISLPVTTLCNGDKHRPIKIECYDWDSNGTHDLIGEFQTTLEEMLGTRNFSRELINHKKKEKKKKNYKNSGFLDLVNIKLRTEPSFLDYIISGIELCFHVAVDFTASNGNPIQPTSLHFRGNNAPNKYMEALMSVGRICEDYDSDKLIPAYGFGARINHNVYHCFPLNQASNATCFGIAGVIDAYHHALSVAELYGPTNFSPVINLVAQQAGAQSLIEKYHILLILTDGVISDMDQTKSAIISASKTPLSIIIVGIGDANFEAMDELDCDKEKLTFQGRTAEQDIVQFVPYRNFSGSFAADDLAREVLYEVPNQLVSFMTKRGIMPRPSVQKGLVHSVTSDGSSSQFVTSNNYPPQYVNTAPYPTTNMSAPPYPLQDVSYHAQMPVTNSTSCVQQGPGVRQAPYAPGHEPQKMSAKEAALMTLCK